MVSSRAQLDSTSADRYLGEANKSRPGATGDWRRGGCLGLVGLPCGAHPPGGRSDGWCADETPGMRPTPTTAPSQQPTPEGKSWDGPAIIIIRMGCGGEWVSTRGRKWINSPLSGNRTSCVSGSGLSVRTTTLAAPFGASRALLKLPVSFTLPKLLCRHRMPCLPLGTVCPQWRNHLQASPSQSILDTPHAAQHSHPQRFDH